MRLQVLVPHAVLADEEGVTKVTAESRHGVFTLLPRHVDFVAPIVAGVLVFEQDGRETVMGVDEGMLVKRGHRVRISVRDAVRGRDLHRIRETVTDRFKELDEREQRARTALTRLEASFYRRFIEQEEVRAW